MKFLFYIVGGFLAVSILVFLLLPMVLPKSLDITVTSEIDAPKSWTYNQFNNLKNQVEFNAFLRKDSALGKQFLYPNQGEKANFKWVSNMPEVGQGDILITHAQNDTIETLVTLNTFNTSYNETFFFEEEAGKNKTVVKWHRAGSPVPYFQRYLIWMNKDKNIKEINESFALLEEKSVSENFTKPTETDSKIGGFQKVYVEGAKMVAKVYENKIGNRAINGMAQKDFASIQEFFSKKLEFGNSNYSKPITYLEKWDTINDKSTLDFGYFIYDEIDDRPEGSIVKAIPATNAVTYTIRGNYRNIDSLYYSLNDYIDNSGEKATQYFWIEEISSNSTKDTLVLKAYHSVE